MCGFAGYINLSGDERVDEGVLPAMVRTLVHRGPDSSGYFHDDTLNMGFRRLSIIDLAGGDQPLFNEDRSVVLMCNGEIFNYPDLKRQLTEKGHHFSTASDVEILLHLYEEEGIDFLNKLNGQFAFALYDRKRKRLFLARDHFGICPLYYTVARDVFIFASEIKAILEHPLVEAEVDLTGLDQILSFPGLVSPRTMFKGIQSLKGGHHIVVENGDVKVAEYWDLDYPLADESPEEKPEAFYRDGLRERLERAVSYRLQADVPVGFYLSGGLDSSLIAALIERVSAGQHRHSFSIGFNDEAMNETKYQRMMAERVGSAHHEIIFDWPEISGRLRQMLYHSESPVKETYNTCSMALSQAARASGIPVVLTGEGADELFAGYVGYRFDRFRAGSVKTYDLETILEDELREKLWGDKDFFYEKEHHAFNEIKSVLYSSQLAERFDEFDCLNFPLVNKERLRGRHPLHRRSYLDVKLRLSDHLISDHGDRMALANSVEARYPFLDPEVAAFATQIPPHLKLNDYTEKYLLKRVAEELLPPAVIHREKYGFIAPGSPYLLQQNIEWVNDTLSFERIKRDGYFRPETIETLKARYSQPGFKLNFPFEDDLLIVVLTFGLFLDLFEMPRLN